MGKSLGAFDPNDSLNRPDLNMCPDCKCFFAGPNCPLCGKECPEAFRAGNRKAVKEPTHFWRASPRRPAFIEWYHSWWFIILALFFFPLAGIVLLVTSPHKKSLKIAVVCVGVVLLFLSTFGIGSIIHMINSWSDPVDTSLSREEYVNTCETVTPEALYRSAGAMEGQFVTLTVTVSERFEDGDAVYHDEKYTTYYICHGTDDSGRAFEIMIRDCLQEAPLKFIPGDTVTVYGEVAGDLTVYDTNYTPHTAPCVYAAYATLAP